MQEPKAEKPTLLAAVALEASERLIEIGFYQILVAAESQPLLAFDSVSHGKLMPTVMVFGARKAVAKPSTNLRNTELNKPSLRG
eukprot:Awhi_evm1s13783